MASISKLLLVAGMSVESVFVGAAVRGSHRSLAAGRDQVVGSAVMSGDREEDLYESC
jgi:hypothetical protein